VSSLSVRSGLGEGPVQIVGARLREDRVAGSPHDSRWYGTALEGRLDALQRVALQRDGTGLYLTSAPRRAHQGSEVVRGKKKFAILQPSSVERLDIGVKLKGVRPEGRFEVAGSWTS